MTYIDSLGRPHSTKYTNKQVAQEELKAYFANEPKELIWGLKKLTSEELRLLIDAIKRRTK